MHRFIARCFARSARPLTLLLTLFAFSLHSSPQQGTKYIVDDLLFKFANPAAGPYMKSFELANKATGHDLRGAISISHAIENENEEGGAVNLNTSLMGIIDHLGEHQTTHQMWFLIGWGTGTHTLHFSTDTHTRIPSPPLLTLPPLLFFPP